MSEAFEQSNDNVLTRIHTLNSTIDDHNSGKKILNPERLILAKEQRQQMVPEILQELGFDLQKTVPYHTAAYYNGYFTLIRTKQFKHPDHSESVSLKTSISVIPEADEISHYKQNLREVQKKAHQQNRKGRPTLVLGNADELTSEKILSHDKVHFWADSFVSAIPQLGENLLDQIPISSSIQEYFARLASCCMFSDNTLSKMIQRNPEKNVSDQFMIQSAVRAVQTRSRIGIYNKSTFGRDKVPENILKDFEAHMASILFILQNLQLLIYAEEKKYGATRNDIGFDCFMNNNIRKRDIDSNGKTGIVYYVDQPKPYSKKIFNNQLIVSNLMQLGNELLYLSKKFPHAFRK
jgi:hypothetical protein